MSSIDFKRIWPLQATSATMLVAGGLHFTLTPAYAQIIGFSQSELGAIGSAYYVGFLLGSILNPLAFRALGHRRLLHVSAVAIAICVAAQPLLPGVAAWIVLRGLVGFLAASIFAVLESWLNVIATNDNRGRTYSAYSMTNQSALFTAQYVFAVIPVANGVGFYLAAAFLLAVVIPFSRMRGAPPPVPAQIRVRVMPLARGSPVAFAGFAANGMATAPFWVLGPAFAREAGFDQVWIGVFMSLPILGSLLTQYQVARLSDRMDRRRVILPAALMASAAAAGVALTAGHPAGWPVFAAIVVFGMSAFTINALCASHLNDRVADADLTEAAGASFLVYGAASAVGPITASMAMDAFGPAALFWHMAAVLALFAAYTFSRILVREPANVQG